jgi:hypothetical protein
MVTDGPFSQGDLDSVLQHRAGLTVTLTNHLDGRCPVRPRAPRGAGRAHPTRNPSGRLAERARTELVDDQELVRGELALQPQQTLSSMGSDQVVDESRAFLVSVAQPDQEAGQADPGQGHEPDRAAVDPA